VLRLGGGAGGGVARAGKGAGHVRGRGRGRPLPRYLPAAPGAAGSCCAPSPRPCWLVERTSGGGGGPGGLQEQRAPMLLLQHPLRQRARGRPSCCFSAACCSAPLRCPTALPRRPLRLTRMWRGSLGQWQRRTLRWCAPRCPPQCWRGAEGAAAAGAGRTAMPAAGVAGLRCGAAAAETGAAGAAARGVPHCSCSCCRRCQQAIPGCAA
jgi:hypothetical protein